MRISFTLLAGSLLLAALASTHAQADPGSSLYEKRLAIIKGTAPGITLIGPASKTASDSPKASSPAASAPSARAAVEPGAETPPSEPGTWLQRLVGPPSGKSLSEAKRLDSPDQGIRLPTASTAASQPADGGQPKR